MTKVLKVIIVSWLLGLPLVGFGQIYHAGSSVPATREKTANWDISLGGYLTYTQVVDPAGEVLFSREKSLNARGLYYVTPWLAAGVEGAWAQHRNFPTQNTYHHKRYGLVTKWVLTPQTTPRVYLLAGGGTSRREISYTSGWWREQIKKPYWTIGGGLEMGIGRWGYLGLETQALYNEHRKLDAFSALNNRWEIEVGLRAGVRF